MNPTHILLALVASFVTLSAADYLIHQVWLKDIYARDAGRLWRNDEEMKAHMPGIFAGQFLVATALTMLWARIALGGAGIQCAVALGVFMGLAYGGSAVIQNAVQPLPAGLMMKWLIGGILQSVLVGIVLFVVHRPAKGCPEISGT